MKNFNKYSETILTDIDKEIERQKWFKEYFELPGRNLPTRKIEKNIAKLEQLKKHISFISAFEL